jgi:hypothetical protein
MKSLLEALSDDGLTGTLTWMFDGTFDVSLGAKQYSCTSASECAAWLQRVSGRNDPEDLYLIQVLHNAEFSGSLSWSRNGFQMRLSGEDTRFPTWAQAALWMRAKGNEVLRHWVDHD